MARYYAEQALGMLETIGMVPALEACDKMLKAAEVELISYENVGSTLVTMFIKGDVAAVKSSIKAGAEAAEAIGNIDSDRCHSRDTIRPIGDVVSIYDVDTQCDEELLEPGAIRTEALGMIEDIQVSYTALPQDRCDVQGAAAVCEMIGFENTASGYISVLVEGDVGACKTAVEAGIKAVEAIGHEVYSSTVIARPHEGLKKITCQYSLDKLLPYPAE